MVQNEVLLVIGILISSAIILFELSNIFILQGKFVQGSLIANFEKDIESRIDKAASAADNVDFIYSPQLKQYTFNTSNNFISIKDKTSGTRASFFKLTPKIVDNSFEDSKTIHIFKKGDKILIFADYQAKKFLT